MKNYKLLAVILAGLMLAGYGSQAEKIKALGRRFGRSPSAKLQVKF